MNSRATKKVLVTGGSGYLAGWTILSLLRKGYIVRATLRNLSAAEDLRARFNKNCESTENLSFHEADLTKSHGWAEALEGCDYVLHLAFPNPPSHAGTLSVLKASIEAKVQRVVMTSSVVTATPSAPSSDALIDESTWADGLNKSLAPFNLEKIIAEKSAWDFMATRGKSTEFSTVLPAFLLGPTMDPTKLPGSVEVISRMLSGKMPGLPRIGLNIVDVRDVAELLISAMESSAAAEQRFIACGKFWWLEDIAKFYREHLDAAALMVPSKRTPSYMMRIVGLFNRDVKYAAARLGVKNEFTSAKAQKALGWRPRPTEETLLDCAKSLI